MVIKLYSDDVKTLILEILTDIELLTDITLIDKVDFNSNVTKEEVKKVLTSRKINSEALI
jgi:hypothetical protein